MKKLLLILILLPVFAGGQIITTFAGTGSSVFSGEGTPATSAGIPNPNGGSFDKFGNYYFADNYTTSRVRRINSMGIITTLVGTGISGFNGDGIPATSALLSGPADVALDTSGNLYIADHQGNRIRKVDMSTGLISTIAGTGSGSFSGDGGPATAATIYNPQNVCVDKHGNIYIADFWNNRIRKVDAAGVITTIAGGGTTGVGDNGPATAAQLVSPWDVAIDDIGNVYIGEASSSTLSNRVRKVDALGIITTIAGNGLPTYTGDGIPATAASIYPVSIALDSSGQMYISDLASNRILMIDHTGIIHLVAGTGASTSTGDGGPATAASIWDPTGLAFDPCGNLYIADVGGRRIRKIAFNPTCSPTLEAKQINTSSSLSISPNPTTTSLTIQSTNQPINQISITNLPGQTIYTHEFNSEKVEVDVAGLPAGMYIIKINNTEVRKFVKE